MPRKKKENNDEESVGISSKQVLGQFLKANKKNHYNYEEDLSNYKISSGSLKLDYETDGGINPGLHRFCGPMETGKTSCALSYLKSFLSEPEKRKGLYIKAEGRLSENMKERSGLKFVFTEEEWEDGTCFVFESQIYETVVELMRQLVWHNDEGVKYFFVLDSVDGLIPENDMDKSFSEATKVAGGAVIASVFMKKMSIALAKRGHIAVFLSQVRADVQLDPYSKEPKRQLTATGGNAYLHFANFIFEFEKPFNKDMFLEDQKAKYDPKKNKYIGHMAKITIKKSSNEKTNTKVEYPIIYGRKNGNSIWNEREILEMMEAWEFATKKGAWITIDEEFIKENGLQDKLPQQVNGEKKFLELIQSDEELKNHLIHFFRSLTLPSLKEEDSWAETKVSASS